MANYATLKAAIQAVIRQNGNNEITGAILQQSLLSMINSLGADYQFVGVATPSTNPGTPDQNVYYLASTAGTYSNFGALVLADGEIAILKYNGEWVKDTTGAASLEKVNLIAHEIGEKEVIETQRVDLNIGGWTNDSRWRATGSQSQIGSTSTAVGTSRTAVIENLSQYGGMTLKYLNMVTTTESPSTGAVIWTTEGKIGLPYVGGAAQDGTELATVVLPLNVIKVAFSCRTTEKSNFFAYIEEPIYNYTSGLGKDVQDLKETVDVLEDDVASLVPLSQIGEVIYGVNLYNKADPDVVNGKYLSASDGTPKNSNSNYMTSGFIPCEVGKTYCFSKGGEAANVNFICYYDGYKAYTNDSINGVNNPAFQTWTVPSGTLGTPAYFRISFRTTNAAVAQVQVGTVVSPYQAFGSAVITYDYRTTIRAALNKREIVVLGDSSMYMDYWPSLLNALSGELGMELTVKICSVSGTSWNSAQNSPLAQWNDVKATVGDAPIILIGAGGVSINSYQLGYDATFARCFDDTSGMSTGTDCAIETLKTILKDRPAARIFLQNNWMYEAYDLTAALKRLKLGEMIRALCDYFGCVFVDVSRGANIHGYTERLQVDGSYPYRIYTVDGVHVSTDIGKRYIFNLWLGYLLHYLADYAIHTISLP